MQIYAEAECRANLFAMPRREPYIWRQPNIAEAECRANLFAMPRREPYIWRQPNYTKSAPMKRDYHIIWHQTIDSTNSEAAKHVSCLDNLSVIAAERQTAGRGQRGNRWTADAGENLTFSVVLKPGRDGIPAIASADQFRISEIAALSVSFFLEDMGIDSEIKWPNDIYCGDRKICGILIENCVRDGLLTWSIIGIGINLNQTVFPPDIPNPVSVKTLTGKDTCLRDALHGYLEALDRSIGIFTDEGGEALRGMYLDRMYRKDELYLYADMTGSPSSPSEEAVPPRFFGIIRGITDNGCLEMELEDGSLRVCAFKEIKYIIDDFQL